MSTLRYRVVRPSPSASVAVTGRAAEVKVLPPCDRDIVARLWLQSGRASHRSASTPAFIPTSATPRAHAVENLQRSIWRQSH